MTALPVDYSEESRMRIGFDIAFFGCTQRRDHLAREACRSRCLLSVGELNAANR